MEGDLNVAGEHGYEVRMNGFVKVSVMVKEWGYLGILVFSKGGNLCGDMVV